MLDAVGDDDELAGIDEKFALATVLSNPHAERTFDYVEEFVFSLVMMPEELALQLGELDVGVVDLANDLGAPLIGEERELVREIDFIQEALRADTVSAGAGLYVGAQGFGLAHGLVELLMQQIA